MSSRRLPLALLGLLLVGPARAGEFTFEAAKIQLFSDTRGRMRSCWAQDKCWRRRSLQQLCDRAARKHFLAVEIEEELLVLEARAKQLGADHVREVVRRKELAADLSDRTKDGWYDVGDNLLQNSWNRFVEAHTQEDFPPIGDGHAALRRAFWQESPELVAFLQLDDLGPVTFSGTPATRGWIESWGEPVEDPSEAIPEPEEDPVIHIPASPVAPVLLPAERRHEGSYSVPPLPSCGIMGMDCEDATPEQIADYTGETPKIDVTPIQLPDPVIVDQPPELPKPPDHDDPPEVPVPPDPDEDTGEPRVPPTAEEDNDAASADVGWETVIIQKNQTLGELGVAIRKKIPSHLRPPLWGPEGIVDLLHQANMGHIEDPNVLQVGDIVRIPTQAWFEKSE